MSKKVPEREIVVDEAGNEKLMIGRPARLKDFDIPVGDFDLDWRCPLCGEIGHWTRTGRSSPSCTTRECRVDRYTPYVRDGEGELGERTEDNSIAHFKTGAGEQLPNSALYDVTRIQMLLAQYRERYRADTANVGLIEDGNGRPYLALWPDDDPNRAVLLAPVEKPDREVEA